MNGSMSGWESRGGPVSFQEGAQKVGGALGLNMGPAAIVGASTPNVRPGLHDAMGGLEMQLLDAEKAVAVLTEMLHAGGVLRASVMAKDVAKDSLVAAADAPMVARVQDQARQVQALTARLRELRDALAF